MSKEKAHPKARFTVGIRKSRGDMMGLKMVKSGGDCVQLQMVKLLHSFAVSSSTYTSGERSVGILLVEF